MKKIETAIGEIQSIPRRFFNAEGAAVGAEERGGGFSLRPLREPLRPLRLISLRGSLVAADRAMPLQDYPSVCQQGLH